MKPEKLESALSASLDRLLPASAVPSRLAESIRYSLLAPGKRIRPRLALEASAMLDLPERAALASALSVEMVHCYTLIHDDLPCMDNDDFRRGRPSNHRKFDEATALLAGDSLMALAQDALLEASESVPPAALVAAMRKLAWAMGARGVIAGQAGEAELADRPGLEKLRQVHAAKTGALFEASILVPAELAGLGAGPKRGAIESFARALGLAFQTADDLEDGEVERNRPMNVLHYLPEDEARRQAFEPLAEVVRAIDAAWGARARELARIAGEVLERLRPAR